MSNKVIQKKRGIASQNLKRVLALVLAGLLGLATIIASLYSAYAEGGRDQYAFEIEILDAYGGARVTQSVSYTNRTGRHLNSIAFSVPANAYRRSLTAPFETDDLTDAYPAGFAPGGVDFFLIKIDGDDADFGVSGSAEDVLHVACDLPPGGTAQFVFQYDVLLPAAMGGFGVLDGVWTLSGFYPRAAVYDALLEQFVPISLGAFGGSLYSDGADYQATIIAPDLYDLAATGEERAIHTESGTTTWRIDGENLRELSIVLTRKARVYESGAEDAKVRVLTGNRLGARRALDIAQKALKRYGEWFGDYPYGGLDIVEANGGAASHPGLIELPARLFEYANRAELERELLKQIARQYFALWVMSNPEAEPWLSETIPGYVALMFIEAERGYDAYLQALNDVALYALQLTLPGALYVDSERARFGTAEEFDLIIARRGVAVINEVRGALGDEAFFAALRLYVEENGGAIASIADFAAAINTASGKEMDLFLMEMLRTIGDYANQTLEYYE